MNVGCGGPLRRGPARRQVAAVCRICVVLVKRIKCFPIKGYGESGEWICSDQLVQEDQRGYFLETDEVNPPDAVHEKGSFPAIQRGMGEIVDFTKSCYCHGMSEVVPEDIQNKKQ